MDFTTHPSQTPAPHHFACIISGDGLTNPLARYLAVKLAGMGLPTARVKSILYFWKRRSPKQMSADVMAYMATRIASHANASFVFIGYSFGAGTLPFALNLLPAPLKEKIKLVVLIAPPAKADFEFHFKSWFHKVSRFAKPVAPEIQTLSNQISVLYVHGARDYVGARSEISTHKALRITALDGGHAFNKNYAPLFDVIKTELDQRIK